MLQALLLQGAELSSGREQAVDALLAAWESFEDTRSNLIMARGMLCRLRFETWLHARVLQRGSAEDEPAGSGASRPGIVDEIVLERFSTLATLAQALRWQQGAPRSLAAAAAAPAKLEPGAVGRLILQHLCSSAPASRGRHELHAARNYP
jgi:hypothetical protein